MRKCSSRSVSLMAIMAATTLLPQAAFAQSTTTEGGSAPVSETADEGLAEIVVTADKTGLSSTQNVPVAVSVFSADTLDGALINNIKDLVQYTPSLKVSIVTASASLYIRGIGSNNVFNGSDPDVTAQIDGVYVSRPFGQFADFVDVDRVEVLRGPQGTLYGRNAIGGTLNIVSRKPSDEFEGKEQLTVGNYSLIQNQFYVSGPLVEGKLQASLSGNYIRHGDYVDNIVPGGKGVGNANRGGLRGQLRFLPTDGIEAITRIDWNKNRERYDGYDHTLAVFPGATLANSIIGDYTKVALSGPQEMRVKSFGASQEVNFTLADELTLKSLTAYRSSQYSLFTDTDGTDGFNQHGTQSERARQFSHEFDLTYDSRSFKVIAGLYYFRETQRTFTTALISTTAGAPLQYLQIPPFTRATSKAAFAQGTLNITPTLSLTAGGRYTQDTKYFETNFQRNLAPNYPVIGTPLAGFPFTTQQTRKYHSFTPKFGVDWHVKPSVLLYVSATKGYKSGGTNFVATRLDALNFGPETIWSYEAGAKTEWLDRKLRVNLSAFKYNYSDLQVQSLIGNAVISITNAADASIKGFEAEITARPIPSVQIGGNLAILDAKYGTFLNASVLGAPGSVIRTLITALPGYNAATGGFNASGNRLTNAPKSAFSIFGQYTHDLPNGSVYLRADYYRQSRVYFDPSNVPIMSQRPYDLANATIGYDSANGRWSLAVIGSNIFNTHYLNTIAANGNVPAGSAGAPRTIAARLTLNW